VTLIRVFNVWRIEIASQNTQVNIHVHGMIHLALPCFAAQIMSACLAQPAEIANSVLLSAFAERSILLLEMKQMHAVAEAVGAGAGITEGEICCFTTLPILQLVFNAQGTSTVLNLMDLDHIAMKTGVLNVQSISHALMRVHIVWMAVAKSALTAPIRVHKSETVYLMLSAPNLSYHFVEVN
jgi:hypothetical protein